MSKPNPEISSLITLSTIRHRMLGLTMLDRQLYAERLVDGLALVFSELGLDPEDLHVTPMPDRIDHRRVTRPTPN